MKDRLLASHYVAFLLAFSPAMHADGSNLVVNGDFEAGNSGFVSMYTSGSLWDQGTYSVLMDPLLLHPAAVSFSDHTSGSGLMMAVNGSATVGDVFWEQTVAVEAEALYDFGLWCANWNSITQHSAPVFAVAFGSSQLPAVTVLSAPGIWENVHYQWYSGSTTSVTIRLVNRSSTANGNDLAIDDIALTAATASCVLPSGIVTWWKAEGNAEDSIAANHGTLVGGAGFTNGTVGQAFSFDGFDDHVRIPASPSLDAGAGNGFTIELWVNPEDVSSGNSVFEWSGYPGSTALGSTIWVGHPWYLPGLFLANLVDTSGTAHVILSPEGIVQVGQWQHLAMSYDRTTGMTRLFLNGVMVAEQNLGIFRPQTTYDLYLGTRPGEGWRYAGLMDEVSLYNRVLTTNEIAEIYQVGSAGKYATDPVIVSQPQDQTVQAGLSVTLSVETEGTGPLAFQWLKDGANLLDDNRVSGAATPMLSWLTCRTRVLLYLLTS